MTSKPRLNVAPSAALFDEPVRVSASGLAPSARVRIMYVQPARVRVRTRVF